jgi:hypothetical protein
MTREQVAEIFYNPAHPINEMLQEEFGYVDESLGGLVIYNPTMEEMRYQLMSLKLMDVESYYDIKELGND